MPAVDGPRPLSYKASTERERSDNRRMAESASSNQSRIELLCAEQGLRMTGQRRVIARVLSSAKDHPDVEEVYQRANEIDRRISLSTVYRTLKLFAEKGILERHDFGHKRGRYEDAARGHHDHLIDVETGRVIEFRNEAIEALQDRIARELGFKLVGHRLELYGLRVKPAKKA
jgi:Fur family transcriptional regulator, ferric uptake regulator